MLILAKDLKVDDYLKVLNERLQVIKINKQYKDVLEIKLEDCCGLLLLEKDETVEICSNKPETHVHYVYTPDE